MLKNLIQAVRPHQWVKNVLVFAALIFSHNLFVFDLLAKVIFVFIVFCLSSSAIYLFNDLMDLESDRTHPRKKYRPIASGQLKPFLVGNVAIFLVIFSLLISFGIDIYFGLITLFYLIINLFYSIGLKNIIIIDVIIVAIGFLLRVVAGAVVINVTISHWLILATFLLALFISFGKRRHEIFLLRESAQDHRGSLGKYSINFLDQLITIITSSTIVVYMLYTVSQEVISKVGNNYLIFTSLFVIYGIFRYLYLVKENKDVGSPTKILITDPHLLINNFLWFLSVIFILYF